MLPVVACSVIVGKLSHDNVSGHRNPYLEMEFLKL